MVAAQGFEPRSLDYRSSALPIELRSRGRGDRSRTYTDLILNQVPLPIGLLPHGADGRTRTPDLRSRIPLLYLHLSYARNGADDGT